MARDILIVLGGGNFHVDDPNGAARRLAETPSLTAYHLSVTGNAVTTRRVQLDDQPEKVAEVLKHKLLLDQDVIGQAEVRVPQPTEEE